MKLKSYNKQNTITVNAPKIAFRAKGLIVFNKSACDMLNIKNGDTVEIAQDQEKPKDWFISLSAGKEGFVLSPLKGDNLKFNCRVLCDDVWESLGFDRTISMLISKDKVQIGNIKYHAIITRSAK